MSLKFHRIKEHFTGTILIRCLSGTYDYRMCHIPLTLKISLVKLSLLSTT